MKIIFSILVSIAVLLSSACTTTETRKDKKVDAYNASLTNAQLGFNYIKAGNAPLAKQRFQLALKENPKNDSAWYGMGYYYEATGNEKLADRYYRKAIAVNPLSGIANNNYGTYLCRRGRHKQAIRQFLMAANNPRFINTGEAYENAGLCALLIPDNKLATIYFKKALDNNPNSKSALLELAKIRYQEDNIARAKALYKRYQEVTDKPAADATNFAMELYSGKKPKKASLPTPRRKTQPHQAVQISAKQAKSTAKKQKQASKHITKHTASHHTTKSTSHAKKHASQKVATHHKKPTVKSHASKHIEKHKTKHEKKKVVKKKSASKKKLTKKKISSHTKKHASKKTKTHHKKVVAKKKIHKHKAKHASKKAAPKKIIAKKKKAVSTKHA